MKRTKLNREAIHVAIMAHAVAIADRAPLVKANLAALDKLRPKSLLGTNYKIEKHCEFRGKRFLTKILSLMPGNLSGHVVCKDFTLCLAVCVMLKSGRRILDVVQLRALYNTLWLFADEETFMVQLDYDVARTVEEAEALDCWAGFRLNGASDMYDVFSALIAKWCKHPKVWFYDYTKDYDRYMDWLLAGALNRRCKTWFPMGYHLIFSGGGKETSDKQLAQILRLGGNVALACNVLYQPQHGKIGDYPKSIKLDDKWFDCFNADKYDPRIDVLDGNGRVGVLAVKGLANATKRQALSVGFARALTEENARF